MCSCHMCAATPATWSRNSGTCFGAAALGCYTSVTRTATSGYTMTDTTPFAASPRSCTRLLPRTRPWTSACRGERQIRWGVVTAAPLQQCRRCSDDSSAARCGGGRQLRGNNLRRISIMPVLAFPHCSRRLLGRALTLGVNAMMPQEARRCSGGRHSTAAGVEEAADRWLPVLQLADGVACSGMGRGRPSQEP